MKASELRIGNYILINGAYCSIGYAILGDFAQKEKGIRNEYLDTLNFAPIPLTPEILERCGFVRHNDTHVFYKINLRIDWFEFPLIRFKAENISNEMDLFELKSCHYVHELQNLYFALTGEELQVNL